MQMSYFTAGKELDPVKLGYIPKPQYLIKGSQLQRPRVLKLYNIRTFYNEAININFYGSKEDMKNNSKGGFNFAVADYL